MQSRWWRTVLVGVTATMLIVGCGGDDDDGPATSSSTMTSPSAPASPEGTRSTTPASGAATITPEACRQQRFDAFRDATTEELGEALEALQAWETSGCLAVCGEFRNPTEARCRP